MLLLLATAASTNLGVLLCEPAALLYSLAATATLLVPVIATAAGLSYGYGWTSET